MTGLKACKDCGAEKPANTEHFYRAKTSRDGLQPYCKQCHKARGKKWAAEHRDIIKERRDVRMSIPEIREKERARHAAARSRDPGRARLRTKISYYRNRQKRLDARREYGQRNRAKELATTNQWRRNNPLRVKMATARKVARRHGCIIEPVVPEQVLARCKSICGICGAPVSMKDLTFDHIIPLSRKGPHSEHNLQVAHYECNRIKNDRSMADLRESIDNRPS